MVGADVGCALGLPVGLLVGSFVFDKRICTVQFMRYSNEVHSTCKHDSTNLTGFVVDFGV